MFSSGLLNFTKISQVKSLRILRDCQNLAISFVSTELIVNAFCLLQVVVRISFALGSIQLPRRAKIVMCFEGIVNGSLWIPGI